MDYGGETPIIPGFLGSLRRCLWALPEDDPPGSEQLQHFGGGWLSLALLSHFPTFQMTLYLTFPVAMFWIANQAEWFEDHVIQRKRELWPPEREDQRRELEEFKERIRKQREERLLRAAQQSS